jgi:hypothetical protein
MQVWIQVLLHVYRLRHAATIVLDEPDVYLHADLQRRLVRVLEGLEAQTILTSHSPEILGEAHTEDVVWVDKSRRRAVKGSNALVASAEAIGSQFNVRIARALRSRVALFVEGKDMKIIRALATTVGALEVAEERGIVVVPIDGFSNHTNVTAFKILVDEFLENSVAGYVILDRDYRSESACREIVAAFRAIGVGCHIWKRKEIESYLLNASAMARVGGLPAQEMEEAIEKIVDSFRGKVFARALAASEEERVGPRAHRVTIIEEFEPLFAANWSDPATRLSMVPPKEVLSGLNQSLAGKGFKSLSASKLARALKESEIDDEIKAVFSDIQSLLDSKPISLG